MLRGKLGSLLLMRLNVHTRRVPGLIRCAGFQAALASKVLSELWLFLTRHCPGDTGLAYTSHTLAIGAYVGGRARWIVGLVCVTECVNRWRRPIASCKHGSGVFMAAASYKTIAMEARRLGCLLSSIYPERMSVAVHWVWRSYHPLSKRAGE